MNWEQFIPFPGHDNLGKLASVYLNEDKSLIKRYFIPGGITVNGNPTKQTEEYINQKWKNECDALTIFNHLWFMPELVEINHDEKYIIQRYYGEDLLTSGFKHIEDIEDQTVEIFRYIYNKGYYKLNGSLSNMSCRGNKVIMFDFKYLSKKHPDLKQYEEYAIDTWLSKISSTIAPRLKALL